MLWAFRHQSVPIVIMKACGTEADRLCGEHEFAIYLQMNAFLFSPTSVSVIFQSRSLSNPRFSAEQGIEHGGYEHGAACHKRESPPRSFHAVDQVHTEDTCDKRGEHQDDGDGSHLLHDARHAIVDDAGVSLHGGVQDVCVNVGSLSGLIHLNGNVLNKVGIHFIDGQFELQLREQRFVATDGGDEIGQTVLQTREPNQVLVVYLSVEVSLGFVHQNTDLLQALQIPHGRGEEEAEHHVHGVSETLVAFLLVADKINHHVGFVVTNRNTHALVENNAQRDGGVRCARLHLLHIGYAKDDERPAVVIVITGTLVLVSDVIQKVIGNFQILLQKSFVVRRGTRNLHPAAGCPFLLCAECVVGIPIGSHRRSP